MTISVETRNMIYVTAFGLLLLAAVGLGYRVGSSSRDFYTPSLSTCVENAARAQAALEQMDRTIGELLGLFEPRTAHVPTHLTETPE